MPTGLLIALVALVVATGAGLVLRRRNGRFTAAATVDPVLAGLGVTAGTVTLLQFSSAFCAPCRTTRVLCADLADRTPGLRHVEVDAETELDAVRALDIWRTPTVLLVDRDGVVRGRASGAPTRNQLWAAVQPLVLTEAGHSR